jgi:nucleoside triphosphate pyrophosphatase
MGLGDWTYTSHVPSVDETPQAGELPADYVLRLAQAKARAAAGLAQAEQYVVAADTVVVDGNRLLGKPADASEATQMLRQLRGHSHKVYTGIAVLDLATAKMLTDMCLTDVPMRSYTDAEIEEYVRSGDPLDKAGAYAIQHSGFRPVERLGGCYASVMGLPLCHLLRLLERLGAEPQPSLPSRCQDHLEYACPVSQAILNGEQVG